MNFWFITLLLTPELVWGWCLPLAGSTACPAFAQYYAGISNSAFDWLKPVWNITAFDDAVHTYVQSTFWNQFNCTTQPSYARYTLSVVCQIIVNNSSDSEKCNALYDVSPPVLCQTTCNQQVQAVKTLVQSQCQSTLSFTTLSNYLDIYAQQCQVDPALNGTVDQVCMQGMANEPDYCGNVGCSATLAVCHPPTHVFFCLQGFLRKEMGAIIVSPAQPMAMHAVPG